MSAQVSLSLAEEFLAAAQSALEAGRPNAAASAAVHAAICATDAVCEELTGDHPVSKAHDQSVDALKQACRNTRHSKAAMCHARQLSAVLAVKSLAEYGRRALQLAQARRAVTQAARFVEWAREVVLGSHGPAA